MEVKSQIEEQAIAANKAARVLANVSTKVKNDALKAMAEALCLCKNYILEENRADMESGRQNGMSESLLDRLMLTEGRIEGMAIGLRQVAELADPVGEVIAGRQLANGLNLTKIRVPLGVIAIIYEARPNVTADAICLFFKS